MENTIEIHSVMEDIITSSGIILAIFSIIAVASKDAFERIPAPVLPNDPMGSRPVFMYGGQDAERLRRLFLGFSGAFLIFYPSGVLILMGHFFGFITVRPFEELSLVDFQLAVDALSFLALVFAVYLIRLLILVRSESPITRRLESKP